MALCVEAAYIQGTWHYAGLALGAMAIWSRVRVLGHSCCVHSGIGSAWMDAGVE